jgi:hypothetical protein
MKPFFRAVPGHRGAKKAFFAALRQKIPLLFRKSPCKRAKKMLL